MVIEDTSTAVAAAESDYGSDIDQDAWDTVFSQVETQPLHEVAITSIEESQFADSDAAGTAQTRVLRVARVQAHLEAGYDELRNLLVELGGGEAQSLRTLAGSQKIRHEERKGTSTEAAQVEHDGEASPEPAKLEDTGPSVRVSEGPLGHDEKSTGNMQELSEGIARERSVSVQPDGLDTRSPLERFRTRPKKPLSVTDIITPAWCELQYWYSLTKYGRVRKTPAMKQGSKIHKEKEREVHTEVPVETVSKEDRFALRLWNIIAGLRTLRLTGLTRELEVIGLVDGEVIIGVIDEISYTCPDEEQEALVLLAAEEKDLTAAAKRTRRRRQKKKSGPAFPADQPTLNDFFVSSQESNGSQLASSWLGTLQREDRSLYLVDIKTRRSKTVPLSGSQMRPTRMQLMMYHRILLDLATNTVSADKVFTRYSLDSSKVFSDAFIAAMCGITINSDESLCQPSSDDEPQEPVDEVTSHNTLSALWPFMVSELAKTIPSNAVSPLLTAEYRTPDTGELIGRRSFAFSAEELDPFVESEMRWWRGQRDVRGVEIEEAYKCGICEFAEKCEWRRDKLEEATRNARARSGPTKARVASAG